MPSTASRLRFMSAVNSPSAVVNPVKYWGKKRKNSATPVTIHSMPLFSTASFGAEFNVRNTWTASAAYNVFFGEEDNGLLGLLTDRDHVALTFKRTF